MSLTYSHKLPDPHELAAQYPINGKHRVDHHRAAIGDVLAGRDPRLMAIVGPCSAWPSEAVLEYADRLARLQENVQERVLLVLRCYIQKPRTTVGWPGPLNAPDPSGPTDIAKGIRACADLMYEAGQRAPLADEMLFTHNADYFTRYLSYVALGARSAEDMEHRYIASGLDMPVGVKNTTGGDIAVGVNGVLSVQTPHTFAFHQHQVSTSGNPYAHLILRGGGPKKTNYDAESLAAAATLLRKANIAHPAIVVDASHDNSGKLPERQPDVVREIVAGIRQRREEYAAVRGVMLESFLQNGKQSDKGPYDMGGLSITDACLGWEETERLIRDVAEDLHA